MSKGGGEAFDIEVGWGIVLEILREDPQVGYPESLLRILKREHADPRLCRYWRDRPKTNRPDGRPSEGDQKQKADPRPKARSTAAFDRIRGTFTQRLTEEIERRGGTDTRKEER